MPGRRSREERRAARAAGVDRSGRPLARALGVNPRQLVRQELVANTKLAVQLSSKLRAQALAQLTRGHGHPAELQPHPAGCRCGWDHCSSA